MAYRLRGNKSIQKRVRKVALEQIDKAIGEVRDDELDRRQTVHQVRKRCKKLRGLICLVRPQFDDYQEENEFFRDAARELSYVRNAQSIIACFDNLVEHFQDQINADNFAPVRKELAERRQNITEDKVGLDTKLDEFLAKLREAHGRAAQWKVKHAETQRPAEPIHFDVRMISKGAKLIGTSIGGAEFTIKNPDTGLLLVQGTSAVSTDDM